MTITKTTKEVLYGGAPGGSSSTTYTVHVQFDKEATVTFDTLWLKADQRFCVLRKADRKGSDTYAKGSETTFKGGISYRTAEQERIMKENGYTIEPQPTAKAPIEHDGLALIRYYINGELKYHVVESFDQLDPVYAP